MAACAERWWPWVSGGCSTQKHTGGGAVARGEAAGVWGPADARGSRCGTAVRPRHTRPSEGRERRGYTRAMGNRVAAVISAALCGGVAGAGAVAWALTPAPAPAYTVAQVQAGLAQRPQAWAGRTVRVAGVIVVSGYIVCLSWPCPQATWFYLQPGAAPRGSTALQLSSHLAVMARAQDGTYRLSPPVGPSMRALLLVSPTRSVPMAAPAAELLAHVSALPLLGASLARLVPVTPQLILRVRLRAAPGCTGRGVGLCPAGVVLSP